MGRTHHGPYGVPLVKKSNGGMNEGWMMLWDHVHCDLTDLEDIVALVYRYSDVKLWRTVFGVQDFRFWE